MLPLLCLAPLLAPAAGAAQLPVRIPAGPRASSSDWFHGSALDGAWSILNPQLAAVTVGQDQLHLQPLATGPAATWYEDGEAVLVYQEITGDFTVTASVHARAAGNPSAPPPVQYRLGGLLARDPGSVPGSRNSVHVAVGAGDAAHPVAVEDKTTTASHSDFRLYPVAAPDVELRITRQGALLSLYYRVPGAPAWTLLRSHLHPEFPATLQVGPMAYSNEFPPDIVVSFDEVIFR